MHLLLILSFTQMALAVTTRQQIPGSTFKYSDYPTDPEGSRYIAKQLKGAVACATAFMDSPDDMPAGFNYEYGQCKLYTYNGEHIELVLNMFQPKPSDY